jgi:hypothetical protein
LNVLAPGSGLIALGRLWLGLSLAAFFLLTSAFGLTGRLIAPGVIPGVLAMSNLGAASVVWLLAQGLLIARIRFLSGPGVHRQLGVLRGLAHRAMKSGNLPAAKSALLSARAIDDSDVRTRIQWAHYLAAAGHPHLARQAMHEASRLDEHDEHAGEIAGALEALNDHAKSPS